MSEDATGKERGGTKSLGSVISQELASAFAEGAEASAPGCDIACVELVCRLSVRDGEVSECVARVVVHYVSEPVLQR